MNRNGQVIILTVLTLGGTLLGATTIAGLLMVYQIRQAGDLGNSGKAIFAADAGIEWGLYNLFHPNALPQPNFSNNAKASVTTDCKGEDGRAVPCSEAVQIQIKSVGTSGNTSRAFSLEF